MVGYGSSTTGDILDERERISTLSNTDRILLVVFLIALVASVVSVQLVHVHYTSIFFSAIFASAPIAMVGVTFCILYRKNYLLALFALIVLALILLSVEMSWVLAFLTISTGMIGVLALVAIVQKCIFYPIVASIEYINIKSKLKPLDRLVSFLFSISGDLDTRNIEIDYNLNRASIPWGEVLSTLRLSFMAGLFIWIYISMNPSWMSFESFSDVPVYLFSLMLYIPLIVLPFSIFMSLNVRISTRYKDFKIYDGIKMTLYKMVVPIVAAFIYVLLAVNNNGIEDVVYFILLSALFNLMINLVVCVVFYRWFEGDVVNEIRSRWFDFRPVSLTMVIEDENPVMKEDVPETPRRDLSDLGEMVFGESHE